MSNKKNLPNIPIYIGDWERDCNVIDVGSEGAWLRICFKLWTKGKQNSIKIPTKSVQNLWRCSPEKMREILDDLIFNEIAEIKETQGFIEFTCRRYVKENKISEIRSEASKSVKKHNKTSTKRQQNLSKHSNKSEQNTDYANAIENDYVNNIKVKDVSVLSNNTKFNEILNLFNSTCTSLKPVLKITKDREVKIQKLIDEYKPDDVLAFFDVVFNKVKSSVFLNGGGKNGFIMTFDWMLKPENFLKIIENNYQDEEPNNKNGKQQNNNQQGGATQAYRERVFKNLTKVQPD